MAQNADWTIIAGTGTLNIAPVGTALPTTPGASLNAAFKEVGHTTEDGIAVTMGKEVGEWASLQSAGEYIRRRVNRRTRTVALELMEWNARTLALAWEAEATTVSGGVRLDLPNPEDDILEWAGVLDIEDGDTTARIVIPRFNTTEDVESTFSRENPAVLPVTLSALRPADGGPSMIPYLTLADAFSGS